MLVRLFDILSSKRRCHVLRIRQFSPGSCTHLLTMSTIYTPPPRLCFRLIGYVSQSAIFSRNSVEPNVSHLNVSHGDYPDQWFTLIHDPKHKGLYAIQSEASGKVLFSRKKTPAVGNADGGGQFDDK